MKNFLITFYAIQLQDKFGPYYHILHLEADLVTMGQIDEGIKSLKVLISGSIRLDYIISDIKVF